MYIQFLLGLGGWVGAAPDDEDPPVRALRGHAPEQPSVAEPPRAGCSAVYAQRGRSRRTPGRLR